MPKDQTKKYDISEDGRVESRIVQRFENDDRSLVVHERDHVGLTGRIAIDLAARFGIIAAEDGGEDSHGRAELQLMEPEQVVNRAVSIAEKMVDSLRARGHVYELPSFNDKDLGES